MRDGPELLKPDEASRAREQAIERKIEAPTEDSRAQTATKDPYKFASKSTLNRPQNGPQSAQGAIGRPKGAPERPRVPQEAPKEGPEEPQKAFLGPTGAPKERPGVPKERHAQGASKSLQKKVWEA